MAVSIRDVARACGVSTYTVSSVINEKGRVSDATRAQVMEVVKEMGYEPTINLPHTRRMRIKRMGLVLPFGETPNSSFYMRALLRAKRATSRKRIDLSIFSHAEMNELLVEHYHRGRAQIDCDGFVFFAPKNNWQKFARTLKQWDIPVAVVRRRTQIEGVYQVYDDDYGAMLKLTGHLLERGHSHIGLVGGLNNGWLSRERIRGYQDALAEYNIPFDETKLFAVAGNGQKKLPKIRESLGALVSEQRQSAHPITALIATNDAMVAQIMSALQQADLRVPDDIALAGIGNEPIASQVVPMITSINMPIEDMIDHAVECLTKPTDKPIKGYTFDNELIIRESTPYRSAQGE